MENIKTGMGVGPNPWWATLECPNCGRHIYSVEHKRTEDQAISEIEYFLKGGKINYCTECGTKIK